MHIGSHREARAPALRWLLLVSLLLTTQFALGQTSSLSRWLTRTAIPDISEVLAQHPRLVGQDVGLSATGVSELDSGLVSVLVSNLGSENRVVLTEPGTNPLPDSSSIDDLACTLPVAQQPVLLVDIDRTRGAKGRVAIVLQDTAAPESVWRRWEWQGTFSRDERSALARTSNSARSDGSLAAPWPEDAVQQAAAALSAGLACDLRVQVRDRVAINWNDVHGQPGQLGDVFNTSRHLLGSFREFDLHDSGADLQLKTQVQPFQGDVLQIWLIGTSATNRFEPVQSVTYMRKGKTVVAQQTVSSPRSAAPNQAAALAEPAVPIRPAVLREKPVTAAREFLDVQMLDTSQSEKVFTSADLQVQLRLVNRASWPIQYALFVSGGHYLNCVPRAEFYRHDRYGYIEGELPAGQSLVRAIDVKGVQHNPHPVWGAQKCAGFKDLEGFENFPGKGYKVTQFVRWRM